MFKAVPGEYIMDSIPDGHDDAQLIELMRLLVSMSQPGGTQTPPTDTIHSVKEMVDSLYKQEKRKCQEITTEIREPGSDTHSSRRATDISENEAVGGQQLSNEERMERQRVLGRLRQRKHQAKRREIKHEVDRKLAELHTLQKLNCGLKKKARGLVSILVVSEEGFCLLKETSSSSGDTVAPKKHVQDHMKTVQDWVHNQAKTMNACMFIIQCKNLFAEPERIMVPRECMDWNIYQNILGNLADALVDALVQSGIHLDTLLHSFSLDRVSLDKTRGDDAVLEITRRIVILTMLYLASPGGSYHRMAETPVALSYSHGMIAHMCCLKETQARRIRNHFNRMAKEHANSFEDMLGVLENLPPAVPNNVAPAPFAAQMNINLLNTQTAVVNIEKRIRDASIQYITDTAAELAPMQLAVLLAAGRGFAVVSHVAAALF
mmetsp:Transcript_498/g.1140  ORF Transcript_498/g.1140 Transcript_498/m.1140 type:complete len:434 (-) Transcript_498:244-1545(-)